MNTKMNYRKKIEAWLLPYLCLFCKKRTNNRQDLCTECQQQLPLLKNSCLHCAHPLADIASSRLCDACSQPAPPYDAIYGLYLYEPPVTQLILELKFKQALSHARILGEQLAKHIQQHWYAHHPLPDCIIPIPLHASRLKERGFNQAVELARPIAKAIQRPIHTQGIQRIKATFAQATLNAVERQQNMRNAFMVEAALANQHVAVIDDVITTGETITAFCQTLRQSGVRQIDVWCCARAHHRGIK